MPQVTLWPAACRQLASPPDALALHLGAHPVHQPHQQLGVLHLLQPAAQLRILQAAGQEGQGDGMQLVSRLNCKCRSKHT